MFWTSWERAQEPFDSRVTPEDLLCKHSGSPKYLQQFGTGDVVIYI